MNILYINHYAGSPDMGMEYRPYYLAQEWIKKGHYVKIVAASFSHVRTHNPIVNKNIVKKTIDKIDYQWIKTPAYAGNGIKRMINIFIFIFKLFRYKKRILNNTKFDVVIASSTYPLDIYPSKKMANATGAKLVFEVHDLWPLSPVELGGMSRFNPFILLLQIAENYAYKKSDKVISILPKTKEYMKEKGMDEHKWSYIPNGIVSKDWEEPLEIPDEHKKIISKLKKDNKELIAYTGAMGVANDLDTLLDVAKEILFLDDNIRFIIVGGGPLKEHLKKRIQKEEINNTIIMPTVSKKSLPDLLKKMDFLYIGLQNQPLFRFGISPNKLIDYMMAGKPVIQAVKAGNDIVKEVGCGVSVNPEDTKAIVNAIISIVDLPISKREEIGEKGKEYVMKNHLYEVLANKFLL